MTKIVHDIMKYVPCGICSCCFQQIKSLQFQKFKLPNAPEMTRFGPIHSCFCPSKNTLKSTLKKRTEKYTEKYIEKNIANTMNIH